MTSSEIRLWQLDISHYSEKARWALDYKRVPHRRRTAMPGTHIPFALWLTRGGAVTFPVLELGDATVHDSTAIIATLEQRYPEPPLYPADPEQRRQALELEDFLDEQAGPAARLVVFNALINEPEMFAELAADALPGKLGAAKGLAGAYASTYTGTRFGAGDADAAARSRETIVAVFDRLDAELAGGDGRHLVGAAFGVADLTAASLLYPIVLPAGGPLPADQPRPPALEPFLAELRQRPTYGWVEETYRRYREPVAATA